MNGILRRTHRFIRKARRGAVPNSSGVTLVELMIATAILSVAVLGMLGAFGGIQKAMQISKNKTLASNLAQEKMQILTQKNYYEVLVTPDPSYYAINGSTNVPYDTTYFPPETILEGGVTYTRLTYVQVAEEDSGAIVVLPPSTPDTGMHLLTISVVWNENGKARLISVSSILSNPNTVMSNSYFTGTVTNSVTHQPIVGALVDIAENMGWRDTADGTGKYRINTNLGSYNIVATAQGYFPSIAVISIGQNVSVTQDFALQPMSSGTVTGTVWVNDRLIISQVVQDTYTLCLDGSGALSKRDVEYVEIYNPTPSDVTLGHNGANWYDPKNPSLWVAMEGGGGLASNYGGEYSLAANYSLQLAYVNTVIPAYTYFLYANTPRFVLNGVWVTADAYYQPGTGMALGGGSPPIAPDIPHFLSAIPARAGYAGLVNYSAVTSNWTAVDTVRWDSATSGVNGAPYFLSWTSTTSIPVGATTSLGSPAGNQLVRISSPSASAASLSTFGRAYNSQNNQLDYQYPGKGYSGLAYLPHNVSSGAFTVIAGRPAAGAVVTGSDPLSTSATAYLVGNPPVANFVLVNVATATSANPWAVLITSGGYTLENDTVTIAASGSIYNFPSSTTILNQTSVNGFIAGSVTDAFGAVITGPSIQVTAGGGHATATNGRYLLPTTPGSIDVVANAGNGNPSYVSISSLSVTVFLGQIHDNVNFVLSQGGRISGFVTRDGINALPGVTVTAFDSNGVAQDSEVSDTSGRFTTINIATGPYTMVPELDSLEISTPATTTAIVGSGQTVFSTTFTVTGALGTISGNVTSGGATITTGVLIVITTSTLAGVPPAPPTLSSTTLASAAIYLASSQEDGTYSVGVRQSTSPTYNAYGYYTTLSSTGGVTFQTQQLTGISVLAGSSVTGKNFAW